MYNDFNGNEGHVFASFFFLTSTTFYTHIYTNYNNNNSKNIPCKKVLSVNDTVFNAIVCASARAGRGAQFVPNCFLVSII